MRQDSYSHYNLLYTQDIVPNYFSFRSQLALSVVTNFLWLFNKEALCLFYSACISNIIILI